MHNPNNQSNDINVDFTSNTEFMLFQLRQRNFCSIHIQNLQEIGRFRTFNPSQNLDIPQKSVLGLLTNFVHFINSYMNPLP